MECFEFGYVIKGDVNDTLKKTVEYCSDGIKQKAKVLAGYIQSDDFLEFCKKDEKFDSTKSILENKQNTVRRILKQYYELKHQDVTTAAAKRQADLLMGFSSVKARNCIFSVKFRSLNNKVFRSVRRSTEKISSL